MVVIDRAWREPTIFEAWGTIEHGATLLAMKESAEQMASLYDTPLVPLFSIKGTSWNEVMTIYYEANGWGVYKPMYDVGITGDHPSANGIKPHEELK